MSKKGITISLAVIMPLALVICLFSACGQKDEAKATKATIRSDLMVQWQIYVMFGKSAVTAVADQTGKTLTTPKSPTENIMFDCGDMDTLVRVVMVNLVSIRQSSFEETSGGYIIRVQGRSKSDRVTVVLTENLSGKQIRHDRNLELTKIGAKKYQGAIKIFFGSGKWTIVGGTDQKAKGGK